MPFLCVVRAVVAGHVEAREQLPRLVPARELELHVHVHPPRAAQRRIEGGVVVGRRKEDPPFLRSDAVQGVEQAAERDTRRGHVVGAGGLPLGSLLALLGVTALTGDAAMERRVNVFHEGDAPFGQLRNQFAETIVVQARMGK